MSERNSAYQRRNADQESNSLEPRVSSLETSVTTLSRDVGLLVRGVDSLRQHVEEHLDRLQSSIVAQGKTQWGPILTGAGLVIAVTTALGSVFAASLLAPVNTKIIALEISHAHALEDARTLDREIDSNRDSIASLEQATSVTSGVLTEKLIEIETQFRWARDAQSHANARTERFIALLWRKAYQEELPPLNVVLSGPNGREH